MKKGYIMILLAAAMLSLTACGAKEEEKTAENTEEVSEEAAQTPSYEPVLYEDLTSKIVSLGEYKGIEGTRTVKEVTDEDVQEEVNAQKKEYAELSDVDREAQMGDVVLIDFTGYVDGETSDQLSGTEYYLELGSGEFVPGFEEQLVGAVADSDVEVNVTFPEYYYEDMAGKEARFEVYVQSVQAYDMDGWSDDFIKENLGYDSEDDMVSSVRKELETSAEEEADDNLEYDLINVLLEDSEFEMQEADIEAYTNQMMSEYETYALMYGMDLSAFLETYMGTTEEQMRNMFHDTANFRVQMTLVFHEIAEREGLEISEEEYQTRLNSLAKDYGYDDPAEVEAVYSRAMVEEQMVQEKVIDLIREHAVVM